ncbi:uncharacterized protein [Eleutherodactylus coqui]|uniref:uncharacterized protein n=1 Tax=Eleutherodactylus coqui TaxID=57060 RepID=UPI00346228CF
MSLFKRFKKSVFKKKEVFDKSVDIPGWNKAPYNVLAAEWSQCVGLGEPWDDVLEGVEPVDVVRCLQKVKIEKDKEFASVCRRGWILLSAYRKMHNKYQSALQKVQQLEKEMCDVRSSLVMAQCQNSLLIDKADRYSTIAEKAAVRVAQYKYRKRRGSVNKKKVHALVAKAGVDWDPDKWDGDIWDSSSDESEHFSDSAEEDEHFNENRKISPPFVKANPIMRRRTVSTPQGPVNRDVVEDFSQQELNDIQQQPQQHVKALIDTGAEATLIYGNPKQYNGQKCVITGLGGKQVEAVQTKIKLKIGDIPSQYYKVMIVPIPEYIIGIDILKGLTLQLLDGKYQFGVKSYITARPVLVGKVKMPPVEIPPVSKVINMKQYRIPGGDKEISDTIQDLLDTGVIVPTSTEYNNPVWPVRKSDGSWRMTVDYRELNKHTPPLTAAVPDTITLIEQVQKHKGTWYAIIDLANAFFTIPIDKKYWNQFAFTWKGRQYTFTRLPQGWIHSPTICHRVVAEHLDDFEIPAGIQVSHYIDDIMLQGESEEEIALHLDKLISHLKAKGWEINPAKVQGPSQSVKFLGIQWNKGHREITPKARQKILDFATPKDKKQTQQFIGLFGFWRQHIPHLGQILAPLYKVTRKKYEFEWTDEQQLAFEKAKEVVQQALDLWPVREYEPVELNVSVNDMYANWSLWQKQGKQKVPLGFWNRKLPDAAQRYTPFEKQLLACYWALIETEQLTVGHEVTIRPEIPIMQWINSNPKTHRIGHAQEASIIKWKWYIQDRAKTGVSGISTLHEKVAKVPCQMEQLDVHVQPEESPVKWGAPFDQLNEEQKKHAWFTDGSAKYQGSNRIWKAVGYQPSINKLLVTTGEGKSSQYAELYAVYSVLRQENMDECHLYTDSWSVANGLTSWLPTWAKNNWKIYSKEVWGKELWQDIWSIVQNVKVTVFHVDAHCASDTLERLYNNHADEKARISAADIKEVASKDPELVGLAQWAHQKCGHLGEKATYQWAVSRGVPIRLDLIMPLKASAEAQTLVYWEIEAGALGPYRASPQAAGLDLCAHEEICLKQAEVQLIKTGIGINMPPDPVMYPGHRCAVTHGPFGKCAYPRWRTNSYQAVLWKSDMDLVMG